MNKADSEYAIVGTIGATYGIKGWLKIYSYTDPITNISDYRPWYIEQGNSWSAIEVTDIREHGKNLVAKFEEQNNPEQARLLTGKKIAVKRSQLPKLEKNEYYWSDLEGLTVVDQHGQTLGKVAYLLATGANDVLVVKGNTEFAIPFLIDDVIKKIDLTAGIITVDWDVV